MKIKIVLSLFLLAITQSVLAAECSYDFNANTYPVVSGRQYKFTTLSSSEGKEYGAFRTIDGNINDQYVYKFLPENGIYGVELKTEVLPYDLPNDEAVSQIYILPLKSNNSDYQIFIHYGNNTFSPTIRKLLVVHITKKTSGSDIILFSHFYSYDSQKNQKIGLYLNQNTNQVGVIINGINQGYITNINDKLNQIGFFMAGGFPPFAANSSNLGKVLSQEYIFDRSQLSSGFPAGTKDICGNPL